MTTEPTVQTTYVANAIAVFNRNTHKGEMAVGSKNKKIEAFEGYCLNNGLYKERIGYPTFSKVDRNLWAAAWQAALSSIPTATVDKLKTLDWSKIRISMDVSTNDHDAGVRAFPNDEPHDYIKEGGDTVMVCITGQINEPHLIQRITALEKRCYVMCEPHLSGHRVIIGFEEMADSHEALSFVARCPRIVKEK